MTIRDKEPLIFLLYIQKVEVPKKLSDKLKNLSFCHKISGSYKIRFFSIVYQLESKQYDCLNR